MLQVCKPCQKPRIIHKLKLKDHLMLKPLKLYLQQIRNMRTEE